MLRQSGFKDFLLILKGVVNRNTLNYPIDLEKPLAALFLPVLILHWSRMNNKRAGSIQPHGMRGWHDFLMSAK